MAPDQRWRDRARRLIGAIVTCLLLVGAALFARTADALPTASRPAGPDGRPASPTSPTPAPTATSAPTPAPADPAEPVRPTSGPGFTVAGLWLRAAPGSDGSFQVVEVIKLATPVTKIKLRPIPLTAAESGPGLQPTASLVQFSAGDQPVRLPDGPIERATAVEWGFPADRIEVRYTLTDVGQPSRPSKPGRALATLGPLTGVPSRLPVIMQVAGQGILTLDCFRLSAAERSCASGKRRNCRQLTSTAEDAVVRVQYDLPLPR